MIELTIISSLYLSTWILSLHHWTWQVEGLGDNTVTLNWNTAKLSQANGQANVIFDTSMPLSGLGKL